MNHIKMHAKHIFYYAGKLGFLQKVMQVGEPNTLDESPVCKMLYRQIMIKFLSETFNAINTPSNY
jgi:hypothetical protein